MKKRSKYWSTDQSLGSWSDLAAQPVLALRRGSVFRDLTEAGFASAGVALKPAMEANYAGSLIGLVDAGVGVAILPGYAVRLTDKSRNSRSTKDTISLRYCSGTMKFGFCL